jgi:hypothetical protein
MKLFKPLPSIIFSIWLFMGCGESDKITAFINTNLVPMTDEKIIENQTVLVKGDRIYKIGPAKQVKIPPDAKVIEGQGAYLMPGLADMHAHLNGDWPLHQLDLYLANGVTTVRDLDGSEYIRQWRDEIKTGKRSGPTLYVAAPTTRGDESNAFKYDLDKTRLVEIHRAEIPIVLGTGAGSGRMGIVPGFSLHDELRILVENGFTPYEAIAAGTVNASKVVETMTGKDDFGTIEVGKRADFILVNQKPLENISHIQDYRGVMAAGQWYEAAYLQATISPDLLSGMPIDGNVVHVRRPDNSFNTDIEIIIRENFRGKLPEDIDSISVRITDSNGISSPLMLPQYRYFEQFRDFWFSLDGPPKIGKYTFTVTSKGLTGTTTDYQTVNRMIPHFDTHTLSPAEGQILTSKTPNFAWAPVEYPDTEIYYRLIIEEPSGKRIYSTDRVPNRLSHTVPEDILKPGRTYRWRVRAMDSADWVEMQNRSDSPWLYFTMAEKLDDL